MKVTLSVPASPLVGTVTIGATVTGLPGNATMTNMQFFVDGALKATDTSSPYSFSWDTTTVLDGQRILSATANYKQGNANKVESTQVAVQVKNTPTQPPPPQPGGVPVNSTAPSISGTATEGQTLVLNYGVWTNSPDHYTLQWLRCDAAGANAVSIAAATAPSYTLTTADVGATIRCAVVAYNTIGPSAVLNTAQTGVVQALASGIPVNTVAPMISGTPVVGNALVCSNGSWTQSPTSYTRQWKRVGAPAFGETRVLPNLDSGNSNLLIAQSATLAATGTNESISFYVVNPAGNLRLGIYDDAGGRPGTLKTATFDFVPVAGWNVVNVIVQQSLTAGTYWLAYLCSSNSLSFRNVTDSSSSSVYVTFPYAGMPSSWPTTTLSTDPAHFSICATMSGAASGNIAGATSATYTVATADIGSTLTCATIAVNGSGNSASIDAAPTAIVTGTTTPPPPPPPPPPSPSNRYTDINFAAGKYYGEGIRSILEAYGSDSRLNQIEGFQDAINYDNYGMTTDPNQRVHLFQPTSAGLPANPTGSSWASWQEIRTTDTPWGPSSGREVLAKASINVEKAEDGNDRTFGPAGFSFGAVRWFAFDILFPLNINAGNGTSVSYERAGGDFNTLVDLHDSGGTNADPGGTELRPTGTSANVYMSYFQSPNNQSGTGVAYLRDNLIQLWDSSGNRIGSAFNVWHEVVMGIKFSADNSGWYEVWFNGVQKAVHTNRQIVTSGEGGPYLQVQNYTRYPTSYIGGAQRSAVVYGGIRAGLTRADVQTR